MLKIFNPSLWAFALTLHVSFLGVEYSAEKEVFNVFIKLKYDDFVLDYRFIVNDDQNFDPSGKIDTSIILVDKYFNKRVQIYADDKKLEGHLTYIESSDGDINMNFLYHYNKRPEHVEVKNKILTELYKDQLNLLIFKYKGFEEGIRMTSDKTEQTFMVK
jgi:hypothetical protein